MNTLWSFEDFEKYDDLRGKTLRNAPLWEELVQDVRGSLRKALTTSNVRFGLDESGKCERDLRGIVQFPLGPTLFDLFFNSCTGYRAQFRIGSENGLYKNAELIHVLRTELELARTSSIKIHMFTSEFKYKASRAGTISEVTSTLDGKLSKVWACEKLIGLSGGIQELFVSRTGPKLIISESVSWSSLYPEESEGWLDVKGAFIGASGPYQLKAPSIRAATLEERGTA